MGHSTSGAGLRIIVMTRFPEPGRTKTRLIPALGADRAAALHRCLITRTLNVALQAKAETIECELEVHYTGGDENVFQAAFGPESRYIPQVEGSLGERMSRAVRNAFADMASRVIVIGTDCPRIDVTHLTLALEQLARFDVVLGPATDGGYYLIGSRQYIPELFEGIDWGTSSVLQQTLIKASAARASVTQIAPLSDVDVAEDLVQCRNSDSHFEHVFPQQISGRISVIIPTLNEADAIPFAINRLQGLADVDLEIIVADGGSEDNTAELARECGVTVIQCNRGRGQQMNAGAAMASGNVLMFLHSDTRLPVDFSTQIRNVLRDGNAAGAFRLSIDHKSWLLRIVEYATNARSRWLQMPYGDQAIFVSAAVFFSLEGFRNIPLMEDFEFCLRLRRIGGISLAQSCVVTSARRWQRFGVVRTTLMNWACVIAFCAGVSPERLARWYRRTR